MTEDVVLDNAQLETTSPFFTLLFFSETADDARRIVAEYIERYNTVRLHSSIGYIAPADKLNARDKEIFKERDRKLEAARAQRKLKRQQAYQKPDGLEAVGNHLSQAV